jgi:GNAT superfamily N-acetyltransferase
VIRIEYRPPALPVEAVRSLDAECFPAEPMDAQALTDAMQQDFWAAHDSDTLVGFACVLRRSDVSWLSRIGTATAHRGQGVATALMRTVVEHCRGVGLPEIVLYVRTDNAVAIRLYERFGFRAVESTYQFVLSNPRESMEGRDTAGIVAVPIGEVPESSLPRFPREWAHIAGMHRPPDAYVLIFRQGTESVGYCRLNPWFPGCFPFVVDRPSQRLMPALRSIREYLQPNKSILKLTVWDSGIAEACRLAGLELSYELLKMWRVGDLLGEPVTGG